MLLQIDDFVTDVFEIVDRTARGAQVDTPFWDDPSVDWGRFDVAVLRSFASVEFNPAQANVSTVLFEQTLLQNRIPFVFWDEFDTSLSETALGWLRYFLAPMQDGKFQEFVGGERVEKGRRRGGIRESRGLFDQSCIGSGVEEGGRNLHGVADSRGANTHVTTSANGNCNAVGPVADRRLPRAPRGVGHDRPKFFGELDCFINNDFIRSLFLIYFPNSFIYFFNIIRYSKNLLD